jgi:hypothetical protein
MVLLSFPHRIDSKQSPKDALTVCAMWNNQRVRVHLHVTSLGGIFTIFESTACILLKCPETPISTTRLFLSRKVEKLISASNLRPD